MTTIKIQNIKTYWANSEGQPYLSAKTQRPYAIVKIKTEDGKSMSGFANSGDPHLNWQVGEEHTVMVEQKGNFLNFRVPQEAKTQGTGQGTAGPAIAKNLERIEQKLDEVLAWIEGQSIRDIKAPEVIKPSELNF